MTVVRILITVIIEGWQFVVLGLDGRARRQDVKGLRLRVNARLHNSRSHGGERARWRLSLRKDGRRRLGDDRGRGAFGRAVAASRLPASRASARSFR